MTNLVRTVISEYRVFVPRWRGRNEGPATARCSNYSRHSLLFYLLTRFDNRFQVFPESDSVRRYPVQVVSRQTLESV